MAILDAHMSMAVSNAADMCMTISNAHMSVAASDSQMSMALNVLFENHALALAYTTTGRIKGLYLDA